MAEGLPRVAIETNIGLLTVFPPHRGSDGNDEIAHDNIMIIVTLSFSIDGQRWRIPMLVLLFRLYVSTLYSQEGPAFAQHPRCKEISQ